MADEYLPTFHFVEISEDETTATRQADADNRQRPAVVEYSHLSTGIGQHRVKQPIIFPVIFKNEPHFTTGSLVVNNPNEALWHDPRGTAGVYMWQRDSRGFFTGAFVWVRVDIERIAAPVTTLSNAKTTAAYRAALDYLKANKLAKVEHHLTFSGTAFKDIQNASVSQSLTPRSTGLKGA